MRVNRRGGTALGLVAVCPPLLAACVSLAGLTGGQDAGDSVVPLRLPDATADRSSRLDAARDATMDAGTDALDGHAADTTDARVLRDTAAEASDAHDAGEDVKVDVICLPIMVTPTANTACSAAEAGTCAPRSAPDGGFAWHPPRQALGVCKPGWPAMVIDACLAPGWTQESCDAFRYDAGGMDCFDCAYGVADSPTYGALVGAQDFLYANVAGCVLLLEPCNLECAKITQTNAFCGFNACASSCLPEAGLPDAALAAYETCAEQANYCTCAGQVGAAASCNETLMTDPVVQGCLGNANGFWGLAESLTNVFCGTGTP
jgi:hypothetical protein